MLYRISERDEKGQFPTIVFFMRRDLKKEEDGGDDGEADLTLTLTLTLKGH